MTAIHGLREEPPDLATRFPPDIVEYVARHFLEDASSRAMMVLERALLQDGRKPDKRMLRCALVSCDNTLESLERQIAGLAIDFRDVIVAGEYTSRDGELVRIRDLSRPFFFED